MRAALIAIALLLCAAPVGLSAADAPRSNASASRSADTSRGDRLLADYFRDETQRLARRALTDIQTKSDWLARRGAMRTQLFEMLSLDPLPERTPLHPVVTGTIERDSVVVEKIAFQSLPGLYVTGNLYRPKTVKGRLPTILLVCGHGGLKKNGVSYGNKVQYQHHDAWFARNGYVCLTIDSVQLGEIEGVHHGTYKYGMWWWNARGFTPAGVEAWNCIRALDYLETRPDVDATRFGVTGRSGGGAYSWWIGALDDRIKVAVPVAGITNLKNHVVDGCVEGHCDCMYPVNTYRWDFCQIAALMAPRPLLIANTDRDPIFPLDGVVDVYQHVRRIYELLGARNNLALAIAPGPHQDGQELQTATFRWFNEHLKHDAGLIDNRAVPLFTAEELNVFDGLPTDQRNSTIFETFVPAAAPAVPKNAAEWEQLKSTWRKTLTEKVFHGWPDDNPPLNVREVASQKFEGIKLRVLEFDSQPGVRLRMHLFHCGHVELTQIDDFEIAIHDEKTWLDEVAMFTRMFPQALHDEESPPLTQQFLAFPERTCFVHVAVRGVGRTRWVRDERARVHIRRRFMLLGQTLDGMRVWDARRAIQGVRSLNISSTARITLSATGMSAGIALYASLFEPQIACCHLVTLPGSHRDGPDLLNILRFLDVPQAVALAADRSKIELISPAQSARDFPEGVARVLRWPLGRLDIEE